MASKTNRKLLLGAAGCITLGAAVAAQIAFSRPATPTPETQTLRRLADRLAAEPLPVVQPTVPPVASRQIVDDAPIEAPRPKAAPSPRSSRPPRPTAQSPEAARQALADAIQNIALMGVTHQGDEDRVWLVDISNNERQVVSEGEDAFGFTIREIDDESVHLTRGAHKWELKLGEKQIPPLAEDAYIPLVTANTTGNGWQGGGRGGDGGRGDRGRSNGGNWGGGQPWGGGGSQRSNRNRGGWGNRGFRPTFGGGFRGGGVGGGGSFGGSNQGNRSSGVQLSTSNPQTARRRGSPLVGGAEPMPGPAAVSNPQTVRRRGTSSGQAFGSNGNSSRNGGTSRTNSNQRNGGR